MINKEPIPPKMREIVEHPLSKRMEILIYCGIIAILILAGIHGLFYN